MLYPLALYGAVCQLHLNKTRGGGNPVGQEVAPWKRLTKSYEAEVWLMPESCSQS